MAACLLGAVILVFLFAAGWGVSASGHEHMHAEASGEWAGLLDKLKRLTETGTVMVLIGVFVFRTAILPASGEQESWPMIERLERICSIATLYALMLTGSNTTLAIVNVVFAIVWLLVAWGESLPPQISTYIRGMCALALILFLHAKGIETVLSMEGIFTLLLSSIDTLSGAIWVGGGLSIYMALARKPELSGSQLRLLLERFMI